MSVQSGYILNYLLTLGNAYRRLITG